MSVKVMARVWERSRHSGGALVLLLAMADFADDDGRCWPAVSTLATKSRMSERNARYALRALEASGEIRTVEGGGRSQTNGYVVTLDEVRGTEKGGSPLPERGQSLQGAKIAGGQPTSEKGGNPLPKKGQPIAPDPSLTIIEPSEETETTDGAPAPVAVGDAHADEPAKREPLGPGSKLYKRLTRVTPNIEQRAQLDEAFEKYGPDRMESVIRDWLLKGYRKQNVKGMLNVLEVGWRERRPSERGILASGRPVTADEAAAIDQVIAEGMQAVAARIEATAPADADRLWHDVHAGLALRMPAATLKAWVDPVQVASFDGETLKLLAPTAAVHSWLTQRLARELDEALADVAPGARVVVLAPEAAVGRVAA